MSYTVDEIKSILKISGDINCSDLRADVLLTDSRSLGYPERTMFFAITTSNNDGHRYIKDLYDRGVRMFCVSRIPEDVASEACNAAFFVVPDVTAALHAIAGYHRQQFHGTVVGITGSRGKTTVKEWLYQLLSADYNIVRSPRSYNSQIGVPLSLWEINDHTQLAIIEAGVSRRGEMDALQNIIRPNVGIITNISHEHDDGFRTMEQKCNEKVELMRECGCVIYCGDDKLISKAVATRCMHVTELWWSMEDVGAPLYISSVESVGSMTHISYVYLQQKGEFSIPFTSRQHVENAIHCLALMLYLNRPHEEIAARMSALTKVGTRLNVIEGVNDCMIIQDSYTSDLHSLAPAIDFMGRRMTEGRSTTLILSDVMHETLSGDRLYQAVAEMLRHRRVDRLIGIGEEFMRHSRYFGADSNFYSDTDTFLASVSTGDFDSELILVKGAPQFHFDRIVDMLEARQHETVLEVNLDAIVHNFNLFRSMVHPTTGVVCMVKASGYGAGSYELAKTLQSQGASYLAVAVLDEGVDLRRAGITMPIMVLNPKVVNYRTMFAYNLEPEIYSFDILNEIIREGEKYGVTDYPVHIKLDTGMHRLGFLEQDIDEVTDILRRQRVIRPSSVFSHLAAADCPEMDDYTMQQFAMFDRCSERLQSGFRYHIMRHVLNSTGISRFPERQYDLVRLGICLYGIPTMNDGSQSGLRQVSSLTTTIISIKSWPAGTTIGYNRRGVLEKAGRVATVPVGYADGINRHLGNGGMRVLVNGVRCPSIGNVCMDACMIDVTGVECSVGDRVEIFGDNIPVQELADTLDTIPYEVLTSVSSRVKRIYYRE